MYAISYRGATGTSTSRRCWIFQALASGATRLKCLLLTNWIQKRFRTPTIELYDTNNDRVKMLVGNKVDQFDRVVSREEGIFMEKELGSLLLESSVKTRENEKFFEDLTLKIMDIPILLEE
ncbi:hypothetical protein K2173_027147 [Erythroxylum novogranatense]|uniref:Uncharacterized protein n=1 Tax=Erythroxylum novogranatense TaxID=1862640 RepID=A0AAV8TYD6_9ROSI|nr:hypothetical protein K2173_027147 [Erythroxylum novogranatense]